ncbi:MAG: DUF177 domain-containing protein [Candidatus Glassbacteria bacterium]|nr:DUF177 domain-containing protein [Candidatus Glassbacteria bacterium]
MSVLIIDLDDLKSGSSHARGEVSPDELEIGPDSPFKFNGPLKLDARLSTTDQLSFHVTGKLSYEADGECRRCLKPVTVNLISDLRCMYALPEALKKLEMSEEERQKEGIFTLDQAARQVDLGEAVREVLVLEYPRYLECANGCRELCSSRGADLNEASCESRDESVDPRWGKLLELKNKK